MLSTPWYSIPIRVTLPGESRPWWWDYGIKIWFTKECQACSWFQLFLIGFTPGSSQRFEPRIWWLLLTLGTSTFLLWQSSHQQRTSFWCWETSSCGIVYDTCYWLRWHLQLRCLIFILFWIIASEYGSFQNAFSFETRRTRFFASTFSKSIALSIQRKCWNWVLVNSWIEERSIIDATLPVAVLILSFTWQFFSVASLLAEEGFACSF